MTKKLTKHGNSLALVIEKPLLDMLKITEKTELDISIENGALIVRPYKKKSMNDKDIDKIAEKIMKKYDAVFKKLSKT